MLVIVCGCETWSVTVQEESRLWSFENVVGRKEFGPNGEALKRSWRKLRIVNEKNHTECDIGVASGTGECTDECRLLVTKPEGKRPLRRPGRRWDDKN